MDYLIGATLGAMLLLLFAGISTHKDEEKSQAPSDEDESLREENARLKKELSELEESHSFTIALFERALITNANKSNEIKVLLQQKEELQKELLEQVNNQTRDSDVEA
jgi:hypothetical protein